MSWIFFTLAASIISHQHRWLQDEDVAPPLWQTVVVAVTLVIMFGTMMFDKIGPDWVMTAGLVLFMACEIVSIKDGLVGFSNEGVLTVMALFIVAEGIGHTGALDHYLGMLLGRPTTTAGALIRLMIPIGILSAFLNNTPIGKNNIQMRKLGKLVCLFWPFMVSLML